MKRICAILIAVGYLSPIFGQEAKIKLLKSKLEPKTRGKRIKSNNNSILYKVQKQNEHIKKLLERKSNTPVIWEGGNKILTGKVYRGVLLNSVVSTNLASPVLVKANSGQGLPYGSKFSCFGTTTHKRVQTLCNRLVTKEKEIEIRAQVLNMDGSAGLTGDYDDGREDLIAGAVISDFAGGVLSAAKGRVVTGIGQVEDSSLKNQVFQGLINSGQTTSDILLEEMKTREPIVTVNAGTEVLIYFQEAVNEI